MGTQAQPGWIPRLLPHKLGSGLKVWGSGLRAWGSGLQVLGARLGVRAQSSGPPPVCPQTWWCLR